MLFLTLSLARDQINLATYNCLINGLFGLKLNTQPVVRNNYGIYSG